MDKAEREALIERLAAENIEMRADQAQRRHARELNGEYFDLPVAQQQRESIVYKTNDAALTQQPHQPVVLDEMLKRSVAEFVVAYTREKLEDMADIIGEETGKVERELRDEIVDLKLELQILRACLRSGDTALIGLGTRRNDD